MLIGEDEDVDSDELAELEEDGNNVFVRRRNLLVRLQATVLEELVEGFGLCRWRFADAVEQGEHLESQRVDLVLSLTFALKLRGCQHLAQRATPVEQISPGICRQS